MRLSELMDNEHLERNHSFPIMSMSWSHSLQQLKGTGLSKRQREQLWEQGYSTHCPNHTWIHISLCPKASQPISSSPNSFHGNRRKNPVSADTGFRSLGSKNIPHLINSTKHSWTPPLCCPEGQLGTKPALLHKPILRLIHTSSRTAEWKENSHFVQLQLCPDSKSHFPEVKWKGINTAQIKKPGQENSLKFTLLLINRIT